MRILRRGQIPRPSGPERVQRLPSGHVPRTNGADGRRRMRRVTPKCKPECESVKSKRGMWGAPRMRGQRSRGTLLPKRRRGLLFVLRQRAERVAKRESNGKSVVGAVFQPHGGRALRGA